MTDWAKLAEDFPASEIKTRPGPGTRVLSYVDARAVAQRLDDVLTPAGWQFTWTHIPGENIVHGRLDIEGIVREDAGYPNSDRDEEPLKAAVSDALKRCAVLFGIGRHLYDDNSQPQRGSAGPSQPPRPAAARPHLVDTNVPQEPDGLGELFAGNDLTTCAIHGVKWIGDGPTDWYHRLPEGGYCRHPENKGRKVAR